jgi:hypothetical protein
MPRHGCVPIACELPVNAADRARLEGLLDRVLYTPIGVLLGGQGAEVNPTQLGRTKVAERLNAAKVIGEIAVSLAVKEFSRRIRDQRADSRPTPDAARSAAAQPSAPTQATESTQAAKSTKAAKSRRATQVTTPVTRKSSVAAAAGKPRKAGKTGKSDKSGTARGSRPTTAVRKASTAARKATKAFPIDAYDDLTAAEIVPQLVGLTAAQLRRISTYERSLRGRRTILGRIDQLLDRVS